MANVTTATILTNINAFLGNISSSTGKFGYNINTIYSNNDSGAFLFPVFGYMDVFDMCCKSNQTSLTSLFCGNLMEHAINAQETFLKHMQLSSRHKIVLATLYSLIMSVSTLGNALVILTFMCNKYMRSTTNLFIASLAASDLLLTFTAIPLGVLSIFSTFWEYGSFSCKLTPLSQSFSVACSSLTLCCIAFDRFYAIVYPLKSKFFQSPKRALLLLFLVWMISISASFPQALSYELVPVQHVCDMAYLCMRPDIDSVGNEVIQVWMLFVILFLLPFVIMSVLYGKIILKLWPRRRAGFSIATGIVDGGRLHVKQRAIKMLFVVMVIFVLCWMPLQCFIIVAGKTGLDSSDQVRTWRAYLQCLAVSSCCYNPVVYGFMNDKFRKNFLNFLHCRKSQVNPVSFSQTNHRLRDRRTCKRCHQISLSSSSQSRSRSRKSTQKIADDVSHM